MIRKLPDGFVLGAATSAYQVEGTAGSRRPCVWDSWFWKNGCPFDGTQASDSYHHYEEDIAACRDYHIGALSISFAWTRLIDADGRPDESGLAFYDRVIDACLAAGVEPYVALYHFDMPKALADRGGWLAPGTISAFTRYARLCFEHFGDRVKYWITMKDPVTEAVNGYVTGLFPPGEKAKIPEALYAMHKMLVAHSRTVNLYRSLALDGKIGFVHRAEPVYPAADVKVDRKAAWLDDVFTNRFVLDAVLDGKYSAEVRDALDEILARTGESFAPPYEELAQIRDASAQLDFLGLNYYTSHFAAAWQGGFEVQHNAAGEPGTSTYALPGISRRVPRAKVRATDWDWSIFPQGLYDILVRIHREYPEKPILLTENGIGLHETLLDNTVEDDDRIDYLRQHLAAVLDAIEDGVPVKGVFVWSLVDAMSWANGYDKRYGLFYVDYAHGSRRYAKKSAEWYRDLAKKRIMLTISGLNMSLEK